MNDQAIEQEIQAKGLTAPRVTPADIEANIVSENYFTAADGVFGSHHRTSPHFNGIPGPHALELLTFCVLTLKNGFTVTGESACASPENFDAEIGRNIARQNAVQKIWPLMGYALKQQLHRRTRFDAEPKTSDETRMQQHGDMVCESVWTPVEVIPSATLPPAILTSALPPHQKRVIDEKRELDERKEKLEAFFETPTFAQLDDSEQGRLHAQRNAMAAYSRILGERIAGFGLGDDMGVKASLSR